MFYCVAYDIRSNKLRLKVSKYCLKIGLTRVQKSVFMGRTLPKFIAELELLAKTLLSADDRFLLLPLDQPAYQNLLFYGKTNDLTRILAKKRPIWHF